MPISAGGGLRWLLLWSSLGSGRRRCIVSGRIVDDEDEAVSETGESGECSWYVGIGSRARGGRSVERFDPVEFDLCSDDWCTFRREVSRAAVNGVRGTRVPGPSDKRFRGDGDVVGRGPEPPELDREPDGVVSLVPRAGDDSRAAVFPCCIRRPVARPTVIPAPGAHVDNRPDTSSPTFRVDAARS
jgi:hypothetical protein